MILVKSLAKLKCRIRLLKIEHHLLYKINFRLENGDRFADNFRWLRRSADRIRQALDGVNFTERYSFTE